MGKVRIAAMKKVVRKKMNSHDCEVDSNNTINEEEDTTTTMSSKRNYFKVVNEKYKI